MPVNRNKWTQFRLFHAGNVFTISTVRAQKTQLVDFSTSSTPPNQLSFTPQPLIFQPLSLLSPLPLILTLYNLIYSYLHYSLITLTYTPHNLLNLLNLVYLYSNLFPITYTTLIPHSLHSLHSLIWYTYHLSHKSFITFPITHNKLHSP